METHLTLPAKFAWWTCYYSVILKLYPPTDLLTNVMHSDDLTPSSKHMSKNKTFPPQQKQKWPLIINNSPKMVSFFLSHPHATLSELNSLFTPSATRARHWLIVAAVSVVLQTAKQSECHLYTLTGVGVSLLQPNYFTVREPQVVLWDRGVLVIHSLIMTYAVVLPKLTL